MALPAQEQLPPGANSNYAVWKCLNRLRSGKGRCKVTLQEWGYLKDADVTCVCRSEPQTMDHLLKCPLLNQECTAEDLAEFNDAAQDCVQLWLKHNI